MVKEHKLPVSYKMNKFWDLMYSMVIIVNNTTVNKGFPCGSAGKDSACSARDLGSILGLGRSPGERKGYPLQYSGLENSMDCTVQRVRHS